VTGTTYDGLGRSLSESPEFIKFIYGEDRGWAGWIWFFIDIVIFCGCLAIGGGLVIYGFMKR
jgi:hypothetical protein